MDRKSISSTDGEKNPNQEKGIDLDYSKRDPAEKNIGESNISFEEKDAFLLEAGNIVLDLISLQKTTESTKVYLTLASQ